MMIEYPFFMLGGKLFLLGIIGYGIVAILSLIVFRKKIPSLFHRIKKIFTKEKNLCFSVFIKCSIVVSIVVLIRILQIPVIYCQLIRVSSILVNIDFFCMMLYLILLFKQIHYKNEGAIRPALKSLIIITLFEIFIFLCWNGTDKIIFDIKYAPNIICSLILILLLVILIIVSKSCSTIEIKPNISNPQSTLTTDENKYLELLMHKIYTKYSEASISIMVEGQQGIDKINFINSIINKLYEQKREVIEVEIDISESENVDNVIQNFSDKLQFKLKEKKFYLGESKRFKKIFPEISTKFSLPVNKSIIQEIVDKIFEDTSKLTIQEILSNLSKSEYLFVTITGINIENVETAYRSIKKLKKLLCYPRNIIVTVWDTEIFEKLSGECKLKLDESDILKIFDETIHLTSRSFEVIFEEFQKNDEGMWKIYDNFSINIITEYKKMTRDMDIDLNLNP